MVNPRFLRDEATFIRLIQISSLARGVYRSWEGSATIPIQAGHFGVPALCLSGSLMEERYRRWHLGLGGAEETLLRWAGVDFSTRRDWDPRGEVPEGAFPGVQPGSRPTPLPAADRGRLEPA